VLHYADGRSAAVGPGNVVLEEGFVVDDQGRVRSYKGTTVEDVEKIRREAGLNVKLERKKKFLEMRNKFEDVNRMTQATLREEKRLAGEERKRKKGIGRVGK